MGAAGVAADLPDIANSPINGEIIFSEGATWTINAVDMPAVEVHTPVASYRLLKAAAGLVSITDRANRQWIDFSANRPRRGLPALGVCCETGDPVTLGLPVMTTVLDQESRTSTHVRFVSKSTPEEAHLVWDFYLTHLTITLNRLKTPYGFAYRGVPAGLLESTDQLRLPDGTSRSAMNPWLGDLPGPAEWAYFADTLFGQSLFLIRHGDDLLNESYQIADGDSTKFVFGSGESTELPARFSIGILGSAVHSEVAERIQFVVDTVR